MLRLLLAFFCFFLFSSDTFAQVEFDTDRNYRTRYFSCMGFIDYQPFGYYSESRFHSIFTPVIDEYAQMANFIPHYEMRGDYDNLVRDVRSGKFDLILGAYSATDDYAGIELVYPALINNPVVVITPLYDTTKISSVSDLKNLKGGVGTYEYFSDYVNQQINALKVQKIKDPYELYKKLFTKEIDYVLASEYNARIILSQLGLRSQISMSSAVWNIPVFVGISKLSPNRAMLRKGLTKLFSDPNTRQKLISSLQEYINNIEEKNIGVVAPDFINNK